MQICLCLLFLDSTVITVTKKGVLKGMGVQKVKKMYDPALGTHADLRSGCYAVTLLLLRHHNEPSGADLIVSSWMDFVTFLVSQGLSLRTGSLYIYILYIGDCSYRHNITKTRLLLVPNTDA